MTDSTQVSVEPATAPQSDLTNPGKSTKSSLSETAASASKPVVKKVKKTKGAPAASKSAAPSGAVPPKTSKKKTAKPAAPKVDDPQKGDRESPEEQLPEGEYSVEDFAAFVEDTLGERPEQYNDRHWQTLKALAARVLQWNSAITALTLEDQEANGRIITRVMATGNGADGPLRVATATQVGEGSQGSIAPTSVLNSFYEDDND